MVLRGHGGTRSSNHQHCGMAQHALRLGGSPLELPLVCDEIRTLNILLYNGKVATSGVCRSAFHD